MKKLMLIALPLFFLLVPMHRDIFALSSAKKESGDKPCCSACEVCKNGCCCESCAKTAGTADACKCCKEGKCTVKKDACCESKATKAGCTEDKSKATKAGCTEYNHKDSTKASCTEDHHKGSKTGCTEDHHKDSTKASCTESDHKDKSKDSKTGCTENKEVIKDTTAGCSEADMEKDGCKEPKKTQVKEVWNSVCPVMGETIETDAKTMEYDGKLVAFCCPSCEGKFKKEPAKYMKNLSEDGKTFKKK